jgi:hypothetical protein
MLQGKEGPRPEGASTCWPDGTSIPRRMPTIRAPPLPPARLAAPPAEGPSGRRPPGAGAAGAGRAAGRGRPGRPARCGPAARRCRATRAACARHSLPLTPLAPDGVPFRGAKRASRGEAPGCAAGAGVLARPPAPGHAGRCHWARSWGRSLRHRSQGSCPVRSVLIEPFQGIRGRGPVKSENSNLATRARCNRGRPVLRQTLRTRGPDELLARRGVRRGLPAAVRRTALPDAQRVAGGPTACPDCRRGAACGGTGGRGPRGANAGRRVLGHGRLHPAGRHARPRRRPPEPPAVPVAPLPGVPPAVPASPAAPTARTTRTGNRSRPRAPRARPRRPWKRRPPRRPRAPPSGTLSGGRPRSASTRRVAKFATPAGSGGGWPAP